VSDDGRSAVVVIALVGNPFSPGYANARQRGPADALTFSSMNVALYGEAAAAWALAERKVSPEDRSASRLTIGSSAIGWEGDRLVVDIDERTTPFTKRQPLKGRIVVHPEAHSGLELDIDERGQHRWWPVAPLARIEVDLPVPGVRFSGHGYHDANAGDVPLEATFETWNWSRARSPAGDAALLTYDVTCASGAEPWLAFQVKKDSTVEHFERSWRAPLGRSLWQLERHARVDEGASAHVVRSLEDGPFYARALVRTRVGGHHVVAMHEQLAAHRLRLRWVRFCTAYKMRIDG
jgi:carotenoid 1,2-hydratase